MKTNKKLALSIASFAAAMACMVGGTYAWYVVSNTATATMSGKTVESSDGLVMGVCRTTSTFATDADATWNGDFNDTDKAPLNVNTAIASNGYATKDFAPLTSGSYSDGNGISLKAAPTEKIHYNSAAADVTGYAKFTLVFKTIKETSIYLNIPQVTFTDNSTSGSSVIHALRIGFESDLSKSILAPATLNGSVNTNVGGVMDLNADGVFDYEFDETASGSRYKEIYYGESVDVPTYDTILKDDNNASNDNTAAPKNNSNPYFLSGKHLGFANDAYAEDVDVVSASTVAKTQQAHGLSYYAYDASVDASNHPIVKTSTVIGEYYYGQVDVTMWIEGWDTACRQDYISGKDFGFTFGFVSQE